jgi:pseudouridine-5'-phosphate glycosidase
MEKKRTLRRSEEYLLSYKRELIGCNKVPVPIVCTENTIISEHMKRRRNFEFITVVKCIWD